ncbi:MAG: baseplate J/gp47 family protein [bacterium]|nr:baseplate J/gp47 family protein [bacterium]
MAVLSELGFNRPTYDELLTAEIERTRQLFGDDIDTSELTALGKLIRLNVYDLSALYEELEAVYLARFPNTATGQSLDRLCVFAGITRNPAKASQHKIKIVGEIGTELKYGEFLVSTLENVTFYLAEDVVLDQVELDEFGFAKGYCEAEFECTEKGEVGNVPVGAITFVTNPVMDIAKIEHLSILELGEEIETDVALRRRFAYAIRGIGSGTIDSIYGALWRVSGVEGVYIAENNTFETDSDGRPPISYECFVLGGSNEDIAKAIFSKAPVGVKSVSTKNGVSVNVTDQGGSLHTIRFSRTVEQGIQFLIKVYVNDDFDSENGVNDIKNNIIQHVNSLKNGEDVIYSSIFLDVQKVIGVVSSEVALVAGSDEDTPEPEDVVIQGWEVARTSADKIRVVVNTYVDR